MIKKYLLEMRSQKIFFTKVIRKKIKEKGDDFNENIREDIIKISRVYQEDGLKNFSERKSYFKKKLSFTRS